ncbi:hypothetical protein ACTXNP_27305 [Pseudomonas helleri]|uniref:hypothetical protein n=1 Tax=Pseudomonas helleri TaxID=1608996 RepID=UPI003FD292E0
MELQNQDRFNDVVDRVFEAISSAFPLPINIDAVSLGIATNTAYVVEGFEQIATDDLDTHLFVVASVRWLESAGYLDTNNVAETYVTGVIFTEKGLQLVGASPISLLRGNYS